MSKKIKIFAGIVLIIVVIIGIASFSGKKATTDSNGLSSTNDLLPITTTQPVQGKSEFSSMLSTVTSINIDQSLFSSASYRALRDYPVVLGSEIAGRINPFAPVGTDSPVDIVNPVMQTLQPGKVTSTTAEFSAQVAFTTTAPVSVVFQYGTTDQFGSATTPVILAKSGTVLVTVKNLTPNTTYKVQAVAVVGSTTTNGNTMSFTTIASPAPKP